MHIIIIAISFIVSTIFSIYIKRNTKRKWLGVLTAFGINSIILGLAYWILYNLDEGSRMFGIDFHNRYVLVIFIPLLTWISFVILSFDRKREVS